ncbi:MAG: M20/M25/M40 family metallo-hydrolase [Anaerolineae bacterium]|nr:M20/M25/M40 family metallo-hydrolase [Anaerolineae bacterium]
MLPIDAFDQYFVSRLSENIAELIDLVKQPSVSAQNFGLEACAMLVYQMFVRRGFTVELIKTPGAPVVIAEKKGRSDKTLLFYNHYDVQPAEPLELWQTPPFDPVLRDDVLYGRGVSDDKGHFVNRLFALDAFMDLEGELPCNVKFVLEGEEEVGSPNLPAFMEKYHHRIKADACIWEFGDVDHRGAPLQELGVRGLLYVELAVTTANQDVHSGMGGSIFPNAAWRLVWALNSLKTPDERVRIPGFYDAVRSPSQKDAALMETLPDIADEYQTRYGIKGFIKGLRGGKELRIAEVLEPSATICGLTAGYQGPGSKTIVPARACAKMDFRLVPDQNPQEILLKLRKHLDAEGFDDVEIVSHGMIPPARTDSDHPFVRMVVDAARDVYPLPMVITPSTGGSGPNYLFVRYLDLPIVCMGFGHPGAQIHSPNENLRLDLYRKSAMHLVRLMKIFAG